MENILNNSSRKITVILNKVFYEKLADSDQINKTLSDKFQTTFL